MEKGRAAKSTKLNILRILRVLKDAQVEGEEFLTINKIARRTGIHKWSVSRTVDLYMPYVNAKAIAELETIGLQAKLVQLSEPSITEEQALRYLSVRI
ncbi:MAG: hypothetical protein ACE5FW_01150 [Candidatus Aenigmatarchaeota archaeon]